jgi:hypothetical protein
MADENEEKKEDTAVADASAGTQLDKILSHVDALHSRLDAMDKRDSEREKRLADAEETIRYFGKGETKPKGDAEEEKKEDEAKPDEATAADGADDPEKLEEKKREEKQEDAEGEKKEFRTHEMTKKDKKDAEKADALQTKAELAELRQAYSRLERSIPRDLTDGEYHELAQAQARADAIFHALGGQAPLPLRGEKSDSYRRRITALLKEHSSKYKDVNVSAISDAALYSAVEETVYADAMAFASSPATAAAGTLRAITDSRSSPGHTITTYVGEPRVWMDEIGGFSRRLATDLITPQMGSVR